MKIKSVSLLLIGAFAILTTLTCRADYKTEFDVPPYALNTTPIGIDGWIATSGTTTAAIHAKVVKSPWDNEETTEDDTNVLKLWRETADTTQIRLKNNLTNPLSGVVKLTVEMAFDFTASNSGGIQFSAYDLGAGHGPFLFGLVNSDTEAGGLFYRGISTDPQIVILPKNQIRVNSIYTFTLSINIAEKLFDLAVAGQKADGTDFAFVKTNIASGAFSENLFKTIYIANTGNTSLKGYINLIDVQAIPEPGSAASLLLGGGIIALFFSRTYFKQF